MARPRLFDFYRDAREPRLYEMIGNGQLGQGNYISRRLLYFHNMVTGSCQLNLLCRKVHGNVSFSLVKRCDSFHRTLRAQVRPRTRCQIFLCTRLLFDQEIYYAVVDCPQLVGIVSLIVVFEKFSVKHGLSNEKRRDFLLKHAEVLSKNSLWGKVILYLPFDELNVPKFTSSAFVHFFVTLLVYFCTFNIHNRRFIWIKGR